MTVLECFMAWVTAALSDKNEPSVVTVVCLFAWLFALLEMK